MLQSYTGIDKLHRKRCILLLYIFYNAILQNYYLYIKFIANTKLVKILRLKNMLKKIVISIFLFYCKHMDYRVFLLN